MNPDSVEQILREYGVVRSPDARPELEAVQVAMLIEDVFGVVLSDAEIDPAVLASAPAVAALVIRHRAAA